MSVVGVLLACLGLCGPVAEKGSITHRASARVGELRRIGRATNSSSVKSVPHEAKLGRRSHEVSAHDAARGRKFPLRGSFDPGDVDPAVQFGANFLGLDLNQEVAATGAAFVPPDPAGAVGPDQFLLAANGRIRVYDKTGNVGALDVDADTFFAGTGVVGNGVDATEPKVVFDPSAGSWIVAMVTRGASPNYVLLAVSTGYHITDETSFTFYAFEQDFGQSNGDTGNTADGITLGVDRNALYVGANMIDGVGSYYGSTGFIIPKTSLVAGNPPAVYALRDTLPFAPQGVTNFVSGAQDSGYFVSLDSSCQNLDIETILNPGTSPADGGLTQVPIPAYSNALFNPAPPDGSSNAINAGDARLSSAHVAQNVLDGSISLLAAHHVGTDVAGNPSASPSQDSVQWFQVALLASGGPALLQSATVYDSGGNSLLFPSLMMNNRGDVVLGYTRMGAGLNPEVDFARRVSADPLGLLPSQATAVSSGAYTYDVEPSNPLGQSWGQYSFTELDPSDGLTLWAVQEYFDQPSGVLPNGGTGSWAIQVVSVQAPPPPALYSITPGMVAHGYSGQLNLYGTSTNYNAFVEPSSDLGPWKHDLVVLFNGTDLLNGQVPSVVSGTQLQMSLYPPTASIGTYAVTEKNPDGQSAPGAATLNIVPDLTGFTTDAGSYTGGNNVGATLTLESAATMDEPIALTASTASGDPVSSVITLPSSQTVPPGQTSVQFTIPTLQVNSSETVTVNATDPGGVDTLSATFTVNPVAITVVSLTLANGAVVGGNPVSGTVTISPNAPADGVPVVLSSSDPSASVSTPLNIAAGANTGSITVNTVPVATDTNVTITASIGSSSQTAQLTVQAATVSSVSLTPATVVGGQSSTGAITLTGNAPSAGLAVTLTSSDPSTTVPSQVTVASGSSTAQFSASTVAVASDTSATITATLGNSSQTATLTVQAPTISSVALAPASVAGGQPSTGTVTLSSAAPSGGLNVTLSSSDPSATVNSPLNISGVTSGQFTVNTVGVAKDTQVTITAKLNNSTQTATLTVQAPKLSSLILNPSTVSGGQTSTGTVTLSSTAPNNGLNVSLTSSDTSTVVPGAVTIAGTTSGTFTATTSGVPTDTTVTITATLNGNSLTATLTVQAPKLASLTVTPNSVVGGTGSTGQVTLTSAAPTAGETVSVTSSDPSATVAPILVLGTSGQFPISTTPVANDTSVTVTATLNGASLTASLTVKTARLASFSASPSTVTGGNSVTVSITLTGPAASSGDPVSLNSSQWPINVPSTVTVPAGQTSITFSLTTQAVSATTLVTLTASRANSAYHYTIKVNPAGVSGITVSANPVYGGTSVTATVNLTGPSGPSGALVALGSSNLGATSVPSAISIAPGGSQGSFIVATFPVSADTTSTLSATLNGTTKTYLLRISEARVQSITLSPPGVLGGNVSVMTVTMTGSAGPTGDVLTLSSNSPLAQVQPSATVPAGQTSVNVNVSTAPTAATSTAVLTASTPDFAKAANLLVLTLGGYNLSAGLANWFNSLNQVQQGQGGVDIVVYGDSISEGGVAGTAPGGSPGFSTISNYLYGAWSHLLKVKLQEHYNPINPSTGYVVGGYGFMPSVNAAGRSWLATPPSGNANDVWAIDNGGVWNNRGPTTTSQNDAAYRLLRSASFYSSTNTARTRIDIDPMLPNARFNRSGVTRVDLVGAQGSVISNWLVDLTSGQTGSFVTPGSGHQSMAVTGGGAKYGAYHWSPTVLQGMNNTSQYEIQLSNASGGLATACNMYLSGAILYNGDENCGVRVHQMGHWGFTSGSYGNATIGTPPSYPAGTGTPGLHDTLDTFSAPGAAGAQLPNSGAVNAKLYICDWITNDVGSGPTPAVSLAQFSANVEAQVLRIINLPTHPCVLWIIPPARNGTYYVQTAPAYVQAIYQICNKYPNQMAILDLWSVFAPTYQNPHTLLASIGWSASDAIHFSDLGEQGIAAAVYGCLAH